MKVLFRSLSAALLSLAVLAPSALAAEVTIRVETPGGTLVGPVAVTTPGGTFTKGTASCAGDSAAGALEVATRGDWGGGTNGSQQRVERILDVNLPWDDQQRYWSVWRNDRASDFGACETPVQNGDEILFYVGCYFATTDCFSDTPLDLRAPVTVRPGQPFGVSVERVQFGACDENWNCAPPSDVPADGARVAGGGAEATTGADGRATLTLTQRGAVALKATRGSNVPETVTVCVTDGQDGFCGTQTPAGETFEQPTTEQQGSARPKDTTAPLAVIKRIREGQRFRRARAPRVLRGRIGEPVATASGGLADDASGLLEVKLRLTRNDRGRCSSYSRTRERFLPRRCGAGNGWWFKVGDSASVEYQLASRLPRGRYVLDIKAMDRAFNIDRRRKRGQNRVVFRVR